MSFFLELFEKDHLLKEGRLVWLSRRLWWREAESLDFVEGLLQCEKGEEEVRDKRNKGC